MISALHGLGGVGKTTLAAALAEEAARDGAFPDGIYWLTLGEEATEAQLLTWLAELVRFFGDMEYRAKEVEPTSAHLRGLLRDKQALIVVDDAWRAEHVRPFRVVGLRGRLLITTRDALIARDVNATLFELDTMSSTEARAWIEGRLGRVLAPEEEPSAAALAEELGRLPLALELAAAQVADGVPWVELLDDLKQEIVRLEVLEPPGADEQVETTRKRLSVRTSFRSSLRRLTPERRERFAWLGVLREDTSLSPEMVTTLWGTSVREARDSLRYLRDKALLMRGVPRTDGSLTYRLHDLMRDEALRLVTAPIASKGDRDLPGLGLTLTVAHAKFLDLYRIGMPPPPWHTIADDGYLYDHLIWHLERAGRSEEIHELLWAEDAAGKNGWYEARERLGQTSGYLADLERTRELDDQDFACDPSPTPMTRQARYALIRASLNSLAGGIGGELLEQLVQHGVWTVEAALTYARCMPDGLQNLRARVALLPRVVIGTRPSVVREALEAAQGIESASDRAMALAALAPHLDEAARPSVVREALEAAQGIESACAAQRPWLRWHRTWTRRRGHRSCVRPWRRPGTSGGARRPAQRPWPRWHRTWTRRRGHRSCVRPWSWPRASGTTRPAPWP